MKGLKAIAATAVVGIAVGTARTETIIDTIPLWDGNISNSWDKIAQTFEIPSVDVVLNTFELGVQSTTGGNYNVLLYEWDSVGNFAVGAALFDAGTFTAPEALTFIEFAIGIALLPGDDYAIIVEWDPNAGGSGVAFSFADQYPGGYNDYTDGALGDPWVFGPDTNFEMAFKAVFTPIPSPSALALLGAAGLISRRRRQP